MVRRGGFSEETDAARYGAAADGSTNLNTALTNAVNAGQNVLFLKEGATFYRMTSTFNPPNGFRLIGRGRPVIRMDNAANARMFVLSGKSDVHIEGIEIDGNKSVTPTDATVVINSASTRCTFERVKFTNCASANTGAVVISGGALRNKIVACQFDDCEGTAVGLSGAVENDIVLNEFRNTGGFAVRMGESSDRNLVQGNRSITSTFEMVGLYYNSNHNRIIGNYAEGSGDNGISISGTHNVVEGNICRGNTKAGIGIWGSHNAISGNVCMNNAIEAVGYWAGIWLHSMYGGTGQFNMISGNVLDDDQSPATQAYGIRVHGNGYTAWAQGQSVATNEWRVRGLNVYLAASSGTTGATPPTHTSGTASDGAVNWTYVTSFVTAARPIHNLIGPNIVHRSLTAGYYDDDNWTRNAVISAEI